MSKEYDYFTQSSEAHIQMSAVHMMVRRLKPNAEARMAPFKYPKKVTKAV